MMITIGEFTIETRKIKDNVICFVITHKSGEGGTYCPIKLEEVIRKFYNENF